MALFDSGDERSSALPRIGRGVRIDSASPRRPEVNDRMTYNWPAAVVYVLILAFFVVVAVGVGLGAYAASTLKSREADTQET